MNTADSTARTPIPAQDLAALVAVAVIWGVNNVAAKITVDHLPPLLTTGLRFLLTAVVLAPFLRVPKGGWRALALVVAFTGPLHFGVQNLGLAAAHDLSPMIIAMQLWIPASVLFAALVLKERVDGWRLGGIGLAFAGVAAMVFDPNVFAQLGALTLIAIAASCYGLGAVLVRRAPALHPLTFQAWISLACAGVMLPASGIFEHGQAATMRAAPWYVWACLIFGGLASSVVANALMFRLVQRYEVSRTTPFLFLSPVVGIGLGGIVLGDRLTVQILMGGVLTLAGVTLVAMAERLRR